MPADPERLRFSSTRARLGLGKALERARDDVVYAGHPLVPEVSLGTEDTAWTPAVSARGLVVVIRDKRIRTRPAELDAFRAAGLRAFGLASKRDLSTWDYLVHVVRHWDAIETLVAERVAGPWFMAIGERDVTDVALAPARHGRSR